MSPAAIQNDGNTVIASDMHGQMHDHETSRSKVLHRSLHSDPLRVVAAKGNYLHLSNGQRILDATGGAAVSCLGHGNERVKAAMSRQMDEVSYCHSAFFATSAAEELAEELIGSTGGAMARAYIVSSGSEAMEAAAKLARQYYLELSPPQPARIHFISRAQSYHGTTLGALSISGHLGRRAPFAPLLMPITSHVSACNAYRGMQAQESEAAYVDRLVSELDAEFVRLGPGTVCAFIAEPVVGAALGCVPAVPGYFKAMKAVCDKYGALLVLDEVMCGIGRTGTMHAWQAEGVVPDVQTLGKGLGGGYVPVAAVLANPRVIGCLDQGTGVFGNGQTYQGHPIACAAALEVLRVIREERLVENVAKMGVVLERALRKKVAGLPYVGDIRGKGLFWGVEFVKDKESKEPFEAPEAVAMGIHEKGMQEPYNISIYPGTGTVDGKRGDHVLIAPAYNVGEQEIETIVDTVATVIRDYFKPHYDAEYSLSGTAPSDEMA